MSWKKLEKSRSVGKKSSVQTIQSRRCEDYMVRSFSTSSNQIRVAYSPSKMSARSIISLGLNPFSELPAGTNLG